MGKKHKSKKHHKKAGDATDGKVERPERVEKSEKPIKLVLKVGSAQEKVTPNRSSTILETVKPKDHSSKKKKKKRSSSKERKKPKLEASSSACPSPSSVSSHEKSKRKRERQDFEAEGSSGIVESDRLIKKIYIKPIEPPTRDGLLKAPCQTFPSDDLILSTPETRRISGHHKEPELSPLQLCLENIHQTLQRKDTQGFFAYPVNDNIAPGYSNIITRPMDFSFMKYKVESNEYQSIEQFRDDFYLMCNNAMVYNAPETIYYKAARKLLQAGAKILSLDKIKNMYRSIGFPMPEHEGEGSEGRGSDEPIDVDTIEIEENYTPQSAKKTKPRSESKHTLASRKILAQVQEASRRVAAELEAKYPNSKLGFLRRSKDGTTTLAVVNPDNSQVPEYLAVNLGAAAGKVTTGSHTTAGFKEDKRNKATPVSYLMYGPFGSFGPTYDSSRATVTKQESDLLYTTYGDDTGIHYARSLQNFVKDASFSRDAADRLLDVLTEGAHSKYLKQAAEREKAEENARRESESVEQKSEMAETRVQSTSEENKEDKAPAAPRTGDSSKVSSEQAPALLTPSADVTKIDIQSLLTLGDEGIDVSFLKPSGEKSSAGSLSSWLAQDVHDKLQTTGRLLDDLNEAQNVRLGYRPDGPGGPTPEAAIRPSPQEKSLAERVSENLKDLTSQACPEDVATIESIRAAMGVGLVPSLSSTEQRQKTDSKTVEENRSSTPHDMSADDSMDTSDLPSQARRNLCT